MARRGTRQGRISQKQLHGHKLSATTFTVVPSGCTIDKNAGLVTTKGLNATGGCTVGKIDFGQGTQYKIYRGSSGVSGASGFTTRLSAGTAQINTGLTTVNEFIFTKEVAGVTVASSKNIGVANMNITVMNGYAGGAGVTLTFVDGTGSAVTTGSSFVVSHAGCSIQWMAIGV